ncbi:MAG: hypothetical protein KF761_11850 [Salinibacterium sp.]|nr:hypothetical protein [Salinibacterium sp.]
MTVLPRVLAALGVLALGLGGALVVASPAAAATFTVTKNADDGLVGSLTYALANLVPGGNTITITAVGTITIPGVIPDITEDVDIVGPAGGVTIETTDTIDHVTIDGATVSMTDIDIRPNLGGIDEGIEITDSNVTLTRVSVQGFDYGITATDSSLMATGVSLTQNVTIGLYFADAVGTNPLSLTNVTLGGTAGAHTDTGAVLFGSGAMMSLSNVNSVFTDTAGLAIGSDVGDVSLDTVTVEDSPIGINFAASGGSTTTVNHLTINRTQSGLYVNVLDDANLTVSDMNIASTDGDGVDLTAVNGSRATITASSVTGSSGSGFILDASDSTIELTNSTSSGNGLGGGCGCGGGSGVELYADNSVVTLDGVTSSGNTAAFGGGIEAASVTNGSTVTVTRSTITGNHATDDGGGIDVDSVADDGTVVTISDSTISSNDSVDFGGGVYLHDIGGGTTNTARVVIQRTTFDGNNGGGYGGALAIDGISPETSGLPKVLIDSSTLSNNTTPYGGGGIHVRNPTGLTAPVVKLLNSTISGNDAQVGGGFDASGSPLAIVISHSTIADNSAHTSGGVAADPNTLQLDNSILSGAFSNNGNTPDDLDVGGALIATFSLVQAPRPGVPISAVGGNILGVDPKLAPLANNGGSTMTRLVAPGSPAYNAGDPAFTGVGLFDQRGQARVFERLDMGAVEWHPALAHTGTELTPRPLLIAFLLLFSGVAMVAFSRLRTVRAVA